MPTIATPSFLGPVRRRTGAVCLLTGPLCFAAAEAVWPETGSSAEDMLRSVAAARASMPAALGLMLATSLLFVPGTFAMLSRRLPRGRALCDTGLGLALWSFLANAALVGVNTVFVAMTDPAVDHHAMVQLLDTLMTSPFALVLLSGHWVLVVAFLLLGAGLWRAGVGPRWAAAAIGLCGVVDMALSPLGDVSSIVSDLLMLAGFAAQAWLLLRENHPEATRAVAASTEAPLHA
ncbi:hypothetical protein CELL_00710 [Cellulomonas sp. T2.31MG-18]|uniref:hypothetical protein n=1 Tax=Cellulomonas sp. T2.31MG-18 TaxID=3157619 RepID=UPI0035E6FA1F